MQFLKNLFKTDADAGPVEKAATYVVPIILLILLVWLFGSCLQIFTNDISRAAATASGLQHTIGFVLLLAAAVSAWAIHSDRVPFRLNETVATIIVVLLLVFSVLFFTGFYVGQYH